MITTTKQGDFGKAVFSKCMKYRYELWVDADPFGNGNVMFIGLNPSTADESKPDPTLRRCRDFAIRWGFRKMCMTNLFGYRATKPRDMKAQQDPVGVLNDETLRRVARTSRCVVAAWGVHGAYMGRGEWVAAVIPTAMCLGKTNDGFPKHPLYLRKDSKLIPFRMK